MPFTYDERSAIVNAYGNLINAETVIQDMGCPMNRGGEHDRREWCDETKGRTGDACRRCHQTREKVTFWFGVIGTYNLMQIRLELKALSVTSNIFSIGYKD